jgi:hypothetical protein
MSDNMKYYRLWDEMRTPDRWHLDGPVDSRGQEIHPWQFKEGKPLALKDTPFFPLMHPGPELEFTLTAFTIPLIHDRVAGIFEEMGLLHEVQLIPARVEGRSDPYFILNTLLSIRCIDDARCDEVIYWLPEDNRPEDTGQYRNVSGLKIDPAKVGSADIFRPWGWQVALIVSERLKTALENERVSGPMFIEV